MNAEAAPLTAARRKRGRWAIVGAVIVLVAIVAIVAAMTLMRPQSSATSNLSTATATKRTIDVTVSGSGSAVAADAVTVNPQISGTVEKLYVSLGETVTAGQTLYTISSDSVQTQELQAEASLLQAKQSVANADASVQQAKNQLYSANTQVLQAENNLKKAQSQPATSTDYAYNVKIAKRQVSSADDAVDSAQTSVDSAELGLEAAQANYKTSKESYSTAVKNTEQTVVVAPSDGVITALPLSVGSAVSAGTNSSSSSSSGSSSGSSVGSSAGGSSSSGTSSSSSSSGSSSSGSSITISDMSSLQVELTVSEVDIPKVAVGQRADVTFDAISGKTFTGSVKSILPNATSSSGVVNYTVYIKLDKLDAAMRTGMTATVDIKTLTASNVVAVPTAAVKTNSADNSKYVVVVDQSGQTSQQKVTAGVSDDTYTQIASGLNAGATVVTGSTSSSSSSSSSGSSSSSSGRAGGGLMMGAGGPPSGGGPGGN